MRRTATTGLATSAAGAPSVRLAGRGCAPPVGGGEQEKGAALYAAGKYDEAAAAFRTAIEQGSASAELQFNLALALWRAGKPAEAETAAEKAATLSDGRLAPLRDGILGNLRYDAAQAAAAAEGADAKALQAALGLAEQARDHYARGGAAAPDNAALARNLERALKLVDELRKKLEEQKQQEKEQQQEKDQEQEKDDEQRKDEKNEKNEKENEKKEKDQKDQQQQDQNEPQQQPSDEEQEPQPQPRDQDEQKDQQQDQQQRQDQEKQGENEQKQQQAEFTPEQKQRLLDALKQFEEYQQRLKEARKLRRPRVEKDW